MSSLSVEQLTFNFPEGWTAGQYDDWKFYRCRFMRAREPMKALDLLAWSPDDRTGWLIEVKDYRRHPRTKASEIHREVADKVLDTLSGLLPARVNGTDHDEQVLAGYLLGARKLRVVLHLEQPRTHSALFPRAIDPADVSQQLRRVLKPVDPHPVEVGRMRNLPWKVTRTPPA